MLYLYKIIKGIYKNIFISADGACTKLFIDGLNPTSNTTQRSVYGHHICVKTTKILYDTKNDIIGVFTSKNYCFVIVFYKFVLTFIASLCDHLNHCKNLV
jgi:hypothetical protein